MIVGDALRLSLVAALRGHEGSLRRNGVRPSLELLDLLDLVLRGPEGTELRIGWANPQSVNVSVGEEAPLAVSSAEAASLLAVSVRSVKRLVASGDLPSTTVGRRRIIDRAAVVEMARGKGRRVA